MELKRTPLYDEHVKLKAKIVDFGGFAMPVQYEGIIKEHQAVREGVGLFDVSHMGEIFLRGPDAIKAADRLCSNDVQSCPKGKALYSVMMHPHGGIVDDLIVYRMSDEEVLLCVNASNIEKDAAWINRVVSEEFQDSVMVSQESDQWGQIAVQGPKSMALLSKIFGKEIQAIKPFHFGHLSFMQQPVIAARTGYTGEDGFEIFVSTHNCADLWQKLLEEGAEFQVKPCGLGARDTLRLEAGLCLYGNDLNDQSTPLEAGLAWVVKLNKSMPAIGFDALIDQKERGLQTKLCGLYLADKKIARHAHRVCTADGTTIGEVSSGTLTPTLQRPVAMAYVAAKQAVPGSKVFVDIRGNLAEAEVCKLPFYRRA